MEKPVYHAFTCDCNCISNRLLSEAIIEANNTSVKTCAQWDTGASGTCIDDDLANELSLVATGMTTIKTPSGSKNVNVYLVSIILPNNVGVRDIPVFGTDIGNQGIGLLIGMDIINMGDFAVSCFGGKTVYSFRVPSKKKTDYVLEINIENKTGHHGTGKRKKKKK